MAYLHDQLFDQRIYTTLQRARKSVKQNPEMWKELLRVFDMGYSVEADGWITIDTAFEEPDVLKSYLFLRKRYRCTIEIAIRDVRQRLQRGQQLLPLPSQK